MIGDVRHTELPILGVLVDRRPPPELAALLVGARPWCVPRAVEGSGDTALVPAAFLACSVDALARLPEGHRPAAVWVDTAEQLTDPVSDRAVAVVSRCEEALAAAGPRAVRVPTNDLRPGARPISPFVRARLRMARGLPDRPVLVVDESSWYWPGSSLGTSDDCFETSLGICAAASVVGPALTRALAWATPVVTDLASAEAVGAVDGVHVLVVAASEPRVSVAVALAADDRLATRLGWDGRLLIEEHEMVRASARLVRRLDLDQNPLGDPRSLIQSRLCELGTGPDATISVRADAAIALLRPTFGEDGHRAPA